jgi:putative two-component system response regulator
VSFLSSGVVLSHTQLAGVHPQVRRASPEEGCLPMFEALARTMNARDAATYEHAERVRGYAMALADVVSECDAPTLEALDHAALLHDVGKLAIPDAILQKPGPLTDAEYDQVKQHATIGADMLAAIAFPGPLALIVRHHHEHWDGSGYPDGLSGPAIPIGARLLSIVDCYDAMTSNRPYRRALTHQRTIELILERRGRMYDPEIVEAFVPLVERLHSQERKVHTPRFPTLVRDGWLIKTRAAI